MHVAKFIFLIVLSNFSIVVQADLGEAIKGLPVQDSGRIKPYDTFAREAMELIYGRQTYKGRSSVEIVTTWMIIPDHWDNQAFVQVSHSGLREALRLEEKRMHYSPSELMANARLPLVMQELGNVRTAGEKLNPYFQEVQRLENQISLYQGTKMGLSLRVAPKKDSDSWHAISELPDSLKEKMGAITSTFVKAVAKAGDGGSGFGTKEVTEELRTLVAQFIEAARAEAPEKYADMTAIRVEVFYNQAHIFRWAWVLYLFGALLLVSHVVSDKGRYLKSGYFLVFIGLLLHTLGMGIRSYLSGRPPVTNMFETVVWVPWGAMIFALLLERASSHKILLICASVISVLCLILTDLSPTVLDKSIHPLEPVLRSTFWLTTHVLVITISYAAFFLAFALGDLALFYFLKDEHRYQKQIKALVHSIYRCVQIGWVLLAAGTILGGVWADYSWGRFWGWDPKETWAFIALMGYTALVHGRLVGWVRDFGMAAGAVIGFSLVIMAWYGVNFVLGAGLHSYGFGAGGVEYVSAFVALHILFVIFVSTVRRSRLRESSKTS